MASEWSPDWGVGPGKVETQTGRLQVPEDKVCTELSQLRKPGVQRVANLAQVGQETSGPTLYMRMLVSSGMQRARGMIWAVLWFGCGVGPTGFMWKRLAPHPGAVQVVRPLRSGTQLEVIAGPFFMSLWISVW